MPFATPRLIEPELIHGKKFRPDTSSVREFPFLLIKKGEKNCDIKLNGRQYEDLHVCEFLNACAVIGWNLDFSRTGFDSLKDEGTWGMCLSKTECENVENLFDYIFDENLWSKKNPKSGGGKGFG
tara:strand:+ start:719 stop:1093 length:375 start_codon:yes stop_codon:yes gene_type:complete